MVILTTTYRHDYVSPATNRYNFLKGKKTELSPEECAKLCPCGTNYPLDGKLTSLPKSQSVQLKSEWTGIAPMGLLIDPRIIPTDLSGHGSGPDGSNKGQETSCMEDQPNRFLKILRTCYPDLYERLNQMPDNELKRRLDVERLKTSYQIDYCNVPEYPEGIYQSLEEKGGKDSGMMIAEDGCAKYRLDPNLIKVKNVPECQDTYKPMKPRFADAPVSSQSIGCCKTGHWDGDKDFFKKPRVTEYMDRISRLGCIIASNDIHNHKKCKSPEFCVHKLKEPCFTFQ